ncbi:MAG: transglycosylase family protein [Nitriliruptoraceae bacterium]
MSSLLRWTSMRPAQPAGSGHTGVRDAPDVTDVPQSGRVVMSIVPGPGPLVSWLRRRVAGLAALAALAAAAAGLVSTSAHVEVIVDGETLGIRAYDATVADVIERVGVDLGPHDAVRPGLDAPAPDGERIDVVRAVAVDVHVDGDFVERVVAPVGSVAGVLDRAGLDDVRELDAQVIPAWTAPVADGSRVDVWVPETVTLAVDGATWTVETFVSDVRGLLIEQDVDVGGDDIISHDPDTPLDRVDRVAIARVGETEELEEIVLERDEIVETTTTLPAGQTRVESEGRDGLRVDRYRVVVVDGEVVERELVAQDVVTEPEPRVVLRGVFEVSRDDGMVAADDPVWDRLARCESRGNWSLVSANGRYYGGLQFHPATWRSVGGTGLPHEHPREVQIEMARRLQARSGWGQWPHCSSVLGLR